MRTDILFLSHLDSDHVNKIDRLMGTSPAKIIVLPYLDSLVSVREEVESYESFVIQER
jgi:hypothetical protein